MTSLESDTLDLYSDDDCILVPMKSLISWLFPVLLIPLYQLLLYRCFSSCSPSMLRCVGTGLFVCTLGYILLSALGAYDVIVSDDLQRYISCTALAPNGTNQSDHFKWYWKVGPLMLYGIGKTVSVVFLLEFIIAQSPDKMKGFVMGIMLAFRGIVALVFPEFLQLKFSLCYGLTMSFVITRCAYAQGRVKRLSPSIYLCVCVCVVKKHGCLLSYRSKIATK